MNFRFTFYGRSPNICQHISCPFVTETDGWINRQPATTIPVFPSQVTLKNLTAVVSCRDYAPLKLGLDQPADLALHGVLDVAWGIKAYRSVVGRADHLALIIDVRCRNKRLSFSVVSSTDGFKLLNGEERIEQQETTWSNFNKLQYISHTLLQTCCSASRLILYGWALPSSTTRGDHSLDSFLEIRARCSEGQPA